jgi:DeoR/GlpR family transcriptional regulator of sugar metabolism
VILKKRHDQIIEMIKAKKTISIIEIVDELQISEITARRDLSFLENNTNLLVRIRGGAQLVEDDPEKKTSYLNERFTMKLTRNSEAKEAIGKLAASLVNEGETIIIDAGTTTIQVAKNLPERKNLTAVVSAINIAEELEDKEGVLTIITGGVFRSRTTTLLSPFIEQSLMSIYAEKVFIGSSGVSLTHGVTDEDIMETEVKKVLLKSGKEIYWLVDSSKINVIGSFQISKIEDHHTIITDDGISAETKALLEAKCRVMIAERR